MTKDPENGHFTGTWTNCVTLGDFLPASFSRIEILPYPPGGELTLRIRQNHRPYAVDLKGSENGKLEGKTGTHTYSARVALRFRGDERVLITVITRKEIKVRGGQEGHEDCIAPDDDTGTIVAHSGSGTYGEI